MVAAVQLNKVVAVEASSPFSYYYEKEELSTYSNNTVYEYPTDTRSAVHFKDAVFNPARIHLTTKLHKGAHDAELVVEHEIMSQSSSLSQSQKLFLCFALKTGKHDDEMVFPLKQSPLDHLIERCNDSLYYKTSGYHVFFCPMNGGLGVGEDFPKVLDNAKAKYKEIFEPNAFDILTNLFTRNDYRMKVVDATDGNRYGWKKEHYNLTEGFEEKKVIDTYMECSLVDDIDGNIPIAEYALTPLDANSYERSLVTFVTALHLLLIIVAGGVLLPYIQCNLFQKGSFLLKYGFLALHLSILFVGVVLLAIGLQKKKGRTRMKTGLHSHTKVNDSAVESRRMKAMLGIYFIFIFLSNVVGMKIQFPSSVLYKRDGEESKYKFLWDIVFPTAYMKEASDYPPPQLNHGTA
jgi:hypothetical protein